MTARNVVTVFFVHFLFSALMESLLQCNQPETRDDDGAGNIEMEDEPQAPVLGTDQSQLVNEPASPIRTPWPADSVLPESHFTVDHQHCLACQKDLGYAMPMNRPPKPHYLFCQDNEQCQTTAMVKCWACGNFNNEQTGNIVFKPGNSAYRGPSQIYSFMCHHCFKDQIEMEPGLEETQEMMKKVREERRAEEEKEQEIASLARRRIIKSRHEQRLAQPSSSYHSSIPLPDSKNRKRPRSDIPEGKQEE